jgi:hypothetical protein
VRHLIVSQGARVLGQGPNPLVINASGRITVAGEINVDGIDALNTASLNTPNQPQSGAPGNCGGGKGGTASPSIVGSDVIGEDGLGPGDIPAGGGHGGHSSFGVIDATLRHAGGGGGGVFTLKAHTAGFTSPAGLNGGNGNAGVNDCVDFLAPANGGLHGPDLFVDADLTNDFFGRKFVAGGNPLAGELAAAVAGQGGGGGGDQVFYNGTPPPPNCLNNTQWLLQDTKGGAGGGGGGILALRALGPIVIANTGKLSAVGGKGGNAESLGFIDPGGGSGGAGSGGMIIVESADASLQDNGVPGNPNFPPQPMGTPGGIRIEGATQRFVVKGGDGGHGNDDLYQLTTVGRGGEGGGGIVQVHSARFDSFGNPVISLAGSDVTSFSTPTVDQAGNGYILLPNFGAKSRARSIWIDTGFAHLGGLGTVTYPWVFSGTNNSSNSNYPLDTTGVVRTDAAGAVFLPPAIPGTTVAVPVGNVAANAVTIPGSIVQNPATLLRYVLNPNTAQGGAPQLFTIVSAAFDGTDMVIQTDPADGPMTAVLPAGGTTTVAVRPRLFRIFTQGVADSILSGQSVAIRFQGADSPSVPATLTSFTPDLDALNGKRFFRFEVDFDLGASGLSTTTPRPEIRFLKIPLRF